MGVRGTNKLSELAAELREQVPPQFLPKQDATLRAHFTVAEGEFSPPENHEAPAQDFSLELEEDTPDVPTLQPVISAAEEEDTDLELEVEPELSEAEINVVDTPGAPDVDETEEGVAAVHEEDAEKLRSRAFQAMDAAADGKDFGDSLNGYQVLGPWVNARADESAEKKRQKEDEKFTQSMLKKMLEDRIRWLDEQIVYWRNERDRLRERVDAIGEAIARVKRGERIDVDENGLPRDRKLREDIEAYRQKYGITLDANNLQDLERLQAFRQQELDYATKRLEERERERQQRQQELDRLESGGISPDEQQRIGERLQTLEGRKAMGEIAALSSDRELNQVIDQQAVATDAARAASRVQLSGTSHFAQSGGMVSNEDDMYAAEGTSVAKTVDPLGFPQNSMRPGFAVAASGEQAPEPEDPAQKLAAAPVSTPSRSA